MRGLLYKLAAIVLIANFGQMAQAANYPTAPAPYEVLSTTDTLAIKIGEAVTTTAPSFSAACTDVTVTTTTPLNQNVTAFTTSLAAAVAAPAAGTRLVFSITICNRDTVPHTIFMNVAPSGTPGTVTAALLAGYTLQNGYTLTLSNAGTVVSTALTFPLTVPLGGTGTNTLAAGAFLTGNGTSAVTLVGPGAAGTIPISSGTAPVMTALSGDITMNSTGVTAIGNLKVTNAMLAGSITSAKLVGSDIATVGTITSGTWQGTAVDAPHGGTGQTVYAIGDILAANTTTALARLADVAAGSYLRAGGVGVLPVWSTLILPNAATTGDILTATSANTVGVLADAATGNALIAGGAGVAPSYGKIGLQTHISGTLLPTNGGTGLSAFLTGDMLYASGVGTLTTVAIGAQSQILKSSGSVPQWGYWTQYALRTAAGSAIAATDNGTWLDVDGSAGAVTITLGRPATLGAGFYIHIRNVGSANAVTIAPNASDGFDECAAGVNEKLNARWSSFTLISTGVNGANTGTTPAGWIVQDANDYVALTASGVAAGASGTTSVNVITGTNSLTAGEWDVSGVATLVQGTTVTQSIGSVNTVSATLGTVGDNRTDLTAASYTNNQTTLTIPAWRVSVSAATQSIYLVGFATYGGGSPTWSGRLSARRVR